MKRIDKEGLLLCSIQGDLFEKSVSFSSTSSEIFYRRFMNSNVVCELDNLSFLDDTKSIEDIFLDLDKQYGTSNYGSIKYNKDIMFWCGYVLRYFAYTYELSSKQIYKLLPLKYVASSFNAYHTLDSEEAINRLLEAKNISFKEKDEIARGVAILRKIRSSTHISNSNQSKLDALHSLIGVADNGKDFSLDEIKINRLKRQ